MRHRFLLSMVAVSIVTAGLLLMAVPTVGQAPRPAVRAASTAKPWTPPKTSWGDPDLQGVYTSDDYINVGMQRNAEFGTRLYLTDEELAARDKQIQTAAQNALQEFANPNANIGTGPPGHWGERARRAPRQTSLIIQPEDGRMPALTEEGRQRQAAANAVRQSGNWDSYSFYIRCITRGLAGSILPVIYGNGTEIVQGPGYVAILQEMVHEARVIPLDRRPRLSPAIKQYMGDARGWFEGDTLVVETTNVHENMNYRGSTSGLKVTERFTPVSKDLIDWTARMEDPTTWDRSWAIRMPLKRDDTQMIFEFGCHEGNRGLENILRAARAEDGQKR